MRVRLKGLHFVKKKLAGGEVQEYVYAWRGGPRILAAPGSPEFMQAYNEATAAKANPKPRAPNLLAVLRAYQDDEETFGSLAERTKADYRSKLKLIENAFGDFPLSGLDDRRTRELFKSWRNELAKKSKRQADYAWSIFSAALSFGVDNGLIDGTPASRAGASTMAAVPRRSGAMPRKLPSSARRPKHLHLPFLLAIWTAQRQGDLLRLLWSAYDGSFIRLRQSKTGVRVTIPVGAPLKLALDAAKASRGNAATILVTSEGTPWTGDGFRSSWRKACIKAGVMELTFHDLRGSAITRLAIAGATVPEISTISGLSLGDVRGILDKHYLKDDVALAENAIKKT